MSPFYFVLFTVLLIQSSQACTDNDELARQDSTEYLANAYGYGPNQVWDPYYYQTTSRIPVYVNQYQGRTPVNRDQQQFNPLLNYLNRNNVDDGNQIEGRGIASFGANILNSAFFNNRFPTGLNRPFSSLANRFPVSLNPNFASPISAFDSCTAPSGEAGICAPGAVCSLFGGRPSGSCLLGGVCCINAITTCGGTITLNNTYWQSPNTAVSSSSTCTLTVKLDSKLVEQKRPICQLRLDFVSFSIAPVIATGTTAGDCTDNFHVGGAINSVPTICGENNGQHMYIEVPSSNTSPSDVQLIFNFGADPATRSWNIKVAMLPCGASYLAPSDCLQYFTSTTGKVSSFNWQNVVVAADSTRQLNNQLYDICFRTELIDSAQRAKQLCLLPCTPLMNGDAFSLSDAARDDSLPNSGTAPGVAGCNEDYIIFKNGVNGLVSADRFCGSALNPDKTGAASVLVCSSIKPFRITYNTDKMEPAATDNSNQGFCLTFQQS